MYWFRKKFYVLCCVDDDTFVFRRFDSSVRLDFFPIHFDSNDVSYREYYVFLKDEKLYSFTITDLTIPFRWDLFCRFEQVIVKFNEGCSLKCHFKDTSDTIEHLKINDFLSRKIWTEQKIMRLIMIHPYDIILTIRDDYRFKDEMKGIRK